MMLPQPSMRSRYRPRRRCSRRPPPRRRRPPRPRRSFACDAWRRSVSRRAALRKRLVVRYDALTMSRRYDAAEIEPRWVARWEDEGLYHASDDPADERPRFYALDMFPYPSGDLHLGHGEAFSGGDAVER